MEGISSCRSAICGYKEVVEDYLCIDIRRWKKYRLLSTSQCFVWTWSRDGYVVASIQVRPEPERVILFYRHRLANSEWKSENYPVFLEWTNCHIGGKRPWFLCPVRECGRRVAILYGGRIFACRHCYKLAYSSQRESPGSRATRKADRIRKKLDWEPGILNSKGWKPKGMHWSTFDKLVKEHDKFAAESLDEIANYLELTKEMQFK